MSYVALYRKYRPQNFDEIVGQKAIVTTLKNQLSSGKVGHAYLFCGMRGTGKTSTARVFAKALNCERGPTENPCNECASCKAITNGSMMDVIEMDAASNRGIDDIRDLREKVNFAPSEGRYKIYIIDEVHMLTTEAFNALLKTLEEPPGYVVFILATTEPDKLPPTILSRCMRFDFTRITTAQIAGRLREIVKDTGVEVEDKALVQIAGHSQGSVRDALSLLDKAMAFGKEKLDYEDVLTLLGAVSHEVFYDISRAVMRQNSTAVLDIVDEVSKQGKDLFRFMDDLLEHFRNLLMTCINADRNIIDVIDEDYVKLCEISKGYTKEKLLSIINILKDAENDVKWSSQPRVMVEAALVKLTLPALWEREEGYIARIQHLEEQVATLHSKLQNLTDTGLDHNVNQPVSEPPALKDAAKEKPSAQDKDIIPPNPTDSGKPHLLEKIKKPEKKNTIEDSKVLLSLQKHWPKVLASIGAKRKMTLLSSIKAGGVRPAKIEKNKLYLLNDGDAVYEEIILSERHTIEEIIREVADIDITLKDFTTEACVASSDQENKPSENQTFKNNKDISGFPEGTDLTADEPAKKDQNISDEKFGKKAIQLFGEDTVTFID